MLSQQRMGKSTQEQNGQVSVFNSVHKQMLWARRFSHYMSDHFCQQEDVDRGKGPRQAPRPGQTRTPKAPRGPPLGAHAAEPGHPRLGAEPHFVAACLVCAEMVPFSYLIWYFTVRAPPRSFGVSSPASACSRSRPCHGPLQHTASGATGTREDSARSSFLPSTKPCPIR